MRTDRQKFEFAQECVRIEKSGGDVLEHIEKNYPSYTPRATWINLQKIVLGRRSDELTDGKPKGGRMMNESARQRKERENLVEVCEGIAELESGEPIRKYLSECGYKSPVSALSNLKNRIKGKDPELYDRIKDKGILLRKKDTKLKGDKKVTAQDWKELEGEDEITRDHDYGRQEAPRAAQEAEVQRDESLEEGNPCAEETARRMLTGWNVEQTPERTELPVCGVQGSYGRFDKHDGLPDQPFMTFTWTDPLTKQSAVLYLSPENWETMIQEIRIAKNQLGLN